MSEAGYDGSSGVKGMQAAAALSLKGPAKKTKNVQASTSSSLLRGSRHLLQTPPPPPPPGDDDALPPPPPGSDDDGGSGAVSTPCYNLMTGVLGAAKAYLYTADESFCCVATGNPEDLSPPQSNFMDDMTLTGVLTFCSFSNLFETFPGIPRVLRCFVLCCSFNLEVWLPHSSYHLLLNLYPAFLRDPPYRCRHCQHHHPVLQRRGLPLLDAARVHRSRGLLLVRDHSGGLAGATGRRGHRRRDPCRQRRVRLPFLQHDGVGSAGQHRVVGFCRARRVPDHHLHLRDALRDGANHIHPSTSP